MKGFEKGIWQGSSRIILGIDIGTTQTAVSFTHLFKGGPQSIHRVSGWPGQEAQKGGSKIPTLVYYDSNNQAVCFGAEALQPETLDTAEDEGWALAQYFKLHLHPQSMRAQDNITLCPLPFGVSLATIYTDFLDYLLQHTQSYFEDHVIDGSKIWRELGPNMVVVLAHPNGWAIREQNFLREAMRNVKWSYGGSCHISFVTEGEASVHFCMSHSNMDSALHPNTDLIVCDAGGSTVDSTAYHVQQTTPTLELKERKASACVQAGGVLVDLECRWYLTKLLRSAGLDEEDVKEYVDAGVKDFELTTKKEFNSPETTHYINFRDTKLTEPGLGIRRGRMALDGSVIENFFSQCVSDVLTSLKGQISGLSPKHLLLVGGFGESLYLRKKLSLAFASYGCEPTIIEDSTSKAAADGAVIWAAKRAVVGRATRVSYGTIVRVRYDPFNPEHRGRKITRGIAGYDGVVGKWSEIIAEGVVLNAQESARRKFIKSYDPERNAYSDLAKYVDEIWAFNGGPGKNPGWVEDKDGNVNPGFEKLCRVEANLSGMRSALQRRQGGDGPYDMLELFLAIQFGGTELSARIEWQEKGVLRTGPASIIPEPVDPPPPGKNMSG
ncbi:hypothetical protein BDV93DRAFT_493856 [Ceratobasidium sp. AG-I]|nr:hypothetical protein BDV93DRAFT_493856 [Ceratobasidium sp. AG-I]